MAPMARHAYEITVTGSTAQAVREAFPDMEIRTDEKGIPFAQIGTHTVRDGVVISIDGSTGLVYSGSCARVEEEEEYPLHPDLLQ